MAFLRETERSIRAYFWFAGIVGLLVGVANVNEVQKLADFGVPGSWMAVLWFAVAVKLVLGAGYIAAGIRLKAELPRGAGWIRTMLLCAIAALVLEAVLVAAVIGVEVADSEMVRSIIGLAVTAYLLAQLRRLADEAQAQAAPGARVV